MAKVPSFPDEEFSGGITIREQYCIRPSSETITHWDKTQSFRSIEEAYEHIKMMAEQHYLYSAMIMQFCPEYVVEDGYVYRVVRKVRASKTTDIKLFPMHFSQIPENEIKWKTPDDAE